MDFLLEYYGSKSDAELMELLKTAGGLTPESQEALVSEVKRRNLLTEVKAQRFPSYNPGFAALNPLVMIFRVLRRIRRWRRRVFPEGVPVWAQDGCRYVGKINPFELLPSLIAISFATQHFFERCALERSST
jgi:hypothetical protein